MIAATKIIAGVTRLIDYDTGRIAKSKGGKPMDGGRMNAKTRGSAVARRQARHINEKHDESR